jgi:hypothetical protein
MVIGLPGTSGRIIGNGGLMLPIRTHPPSEISALSEMTVSIS